MPLRNRSRFASSLSLRVLGVAVGAGLAAQACANGTPSGSNNTQEELSSGSGGPACGIGTLALANAGGSACGKNSLGGSAFDTSCTGNGGEPEYWCADFVMWVWSHSGADVSGLSAAAGSFYTYGQTNGTLTNTPSVGDAVVFNYTGGGVATHVAIIAQVNSDGTIETVSGDWGGESGSEAHFSSTSSVVVNSPAYPGKVGTTPAIMGMTISAFVGPKGLSTCDSDGGTSSSSEDSGGGGGGTAGSGGASGSGGGGSDGSGSGGSSGSGSGGSSGSSSGKSGKGGKGGSSGSGSSGSDAGAGEGGAYAFIEPHGGDRHHSVDVAPGASEIIPFAWHDASGLAPPADLWVQADGRTVLQVSAVGDHPFVRAGLDVIPLARDERYRIVLTSDDDSIDLINVMVVDASDKVVLRTRAQAGDSTADVVLPATFWRASIEADLP